ncbi:hypothetical protein CSC67_07145 [Pusillimonas caeni]|nr:hypothetical protein CSC67_07145 [Pusillimonas caeni]
MMTTDSLHVVVHLVVLSGVSSWLSSARHCACSAGVDSASRAPRFAPPSAQPPNVQPSCLERVWPAAFTAFVGVLAAHSAAPPSRRRRERKRQAKAEGKIKGCGTCPPAKPVCTWGWRGTTQLCRCAAWGAWPAPMQACPRASHARTRHSFLKERP